MTPNVSIVIVNWNSRDVLRECLLSIQRETRKSFEIIVVDNASTDGSSKMMADEFPDVQLIANDENLGFAAANNQAIEIVSGENILLLNPDTIVLEGAIDTMLDWLSENPDVGCVGCQVMESENQIQRTCFSDPGPLNLFLGEISLHRAMPRWRFLGTPEYSWWDRRTERNVDVVSGMFMLVPRRVIDKVGSMDDAFFVYSEEADWCRRIRLAGYRCVFAPVARILHCDGGGKSTSQTWGRMYVQMQKSKLIYVGKYYGLSGRIFAKATLLGSMLARVIVFGTIALLTRRDRPRSQANLAWAAARFHLTGVEPGP